MLYHRDSYSFRREGYFFQNLKSSFRQFQFEIPNFKGNMRNRLDEFVNRAVRLKPHPFNTIRTLGKSRYVEFQMRDKFLILFSFGSGNTQMVILPAPFRYCCRRLKVFSLFNLHFFTFTALSVIFRNISRRALFKDTVTPLQDTTITNNKMSCKPNYSITDIQQFPLNPCGSWSAVIGNLFPDTPAA